MLYLVAALARKLNLLPVPQNTQATPTPEQAAADLSALNDGTFWQSDMTHCNASNYSGVPNSPMSPQAGSSPRSTIAGGSFGAGPISYSAAVTAPQTPASAFPQHPVLTRVSPHDEGMPAASDSRTPMDISNPLPVDLAFLGHKIETFINKQAAKFIKQAKQLLPAALETAIKEKVDSLQEKHMADMQQVRKQAEADAQKLTSSFQRQVCMKDEQISSLHKGIEVTKSRYAALESDLKSTEQQRDNLLAQVAIKAKEVETLNVALDDLHSELQDAKCRGTDLLTFQGLTSSEANPNSLKVALKDLMSACQDMVGLIITNRFANPMNVPCIVDWENMGQRQHGWEQLKRCGLQHAVLAELDRVVFKGFRGAHLVIPANAYFIHSSIDKEAVLLQLQLEKKRSAAWLRAVTPTAAYGIDAAAQGGLPSDLVDHHAGQFLTNLLCSNRLLRWDMAVDPTAIVSPAVRTLVAAALKIQIIASTMHSQLIRVVVPGWLKDTGLPSTPAAPAAWAQWPGVLPVDRDWMQPGVVLTAASGALPRGIEAAAVYCQEPAVVQLTERVGDLPEFGGKDAQQGVYKVLVKARMAVAR